MRQLNVAPQVAQLLPPAHLAQLQAEVNDPNNRCPSCGQLVTGPAAEAVVLTDGDYHLVRLAHPECARSGIYDTPGLRVDEAVRLAAGLNINTSLGRRPGPTPRALVFIELQDNLSLISPGSDPTTAEDPLAVYANTLGLEPVAGGPMQLTPAHSATSSLHVDADRRLILIQPDGRDILWDEPDEPLTAWCQTATEDEAIALLITARGLGLSQHPPTITRALTTQPAWGATLTVTGLSQKS